jgi:hypothetical protein
MSFKGIMRYKYRYISIFTFIFNMQEGEDDWRQNEGGSRYCGK